ncbi:NUCLEAR FUSION DEFECTIVE 4-like [Olea europaea subsp. europaea]|uniref:NUCLEAR FUSION DEFECTIVE 4-like n=1 Tax=Olea europaea subsp. europaea TaxID=158383 RepID=A0A8S0TLA7_OLEEU|nr:NUCLEAR FUSION DEFECTIVE 4-like [Olea europaea subsp. europaea]
MARLMENISSFFNNRWLVFVFAVWIQSCAGIGYLFGSLSPTIKRSLNYNQRQVARLGVAVMGWEIGWTLYGEVAQRVQRRWYIVMLARANLTPRNATDFHLPSIILRTTSVIWNHKVLLESLHIIHFLPLDQ